MQKKIIYYIVFSLFSLLIIIPLFYTIITIFFDLNLLKFNLHLINKGLFVLLLKSMLIALLTATSSTVSGIILAFLLYKTHLYNKNSFKILLLIPLFISPYILAVAWRDFFYLFFDNTDLISSPAGVIFIFTIIYTPLSMLITGSALSNVDAQFEESALLLTNLPKVIFKIIIPLIKPAIISSWVLIFIFSIAEFSIPAFLGVKVFTTEIFTQFSAFYNHSLAILQSLLLVIICVILLFSEGKYLSGASFLSINSKGSKSKMYDLGKKNYLSCYLSFCIY